MKALARVEVDLSTDAEARLIAAALAPEDAGFIVTRVEGTSLVAEAEADSIGALLHTLDDYLACLAAASGATKYR